MFGLSSIATRVLIGVGLALTVALSVLGYMLRSEIHENGVLVVQKQQAEEATKTAQDAMARDREALGHLRVKSAATARLGARAVHSLAVAKDAAPAWTTQEVPENVRKVINEATSDELVPSDPDGMRDSTGENTDYPAP